jgi:hypothetical protein
MVPSEDLFTQDPDDTNSPSISDSQHRRQAAMQAAENLALVLRAGDRVTKALHLVLANAVTIKTDGIAQDRSGQRTYTISPAEGCTCEDATCRTRFCKYYIAVLIAKRAAALLQGTGHVSGPEPSQEGTVTTALTFADWQVHEAPAACTLIFVCKGVDVHLTMRDVSDEALFAHLRRIVQNAGKDSHLFRGKQILASICEGGKNLDSGE